MVRQTYYGVDSKQYQMLEGNIKKYAQLTRAMFNKSIDAKDKAEIQEEKENLKLQIQDCLLENATILGFLPMEKIEDLSGVIRGIENEEIKSYLQNNFIPIEKIEDILLNLMNLPETESLRNVIFFLEKAKSNKQNIIVWIM